MKKESNLKYYVAMIVLVVLALTFLVSQINNNEKQSELENRVLELKQEKEFCDNLQINIGTSKSGYLEDVPNTVVSYSLCSNEDTSVMQIITFVDGYKIEEMRKLEKDSCMLQQLIYASGYSEKIQCKDIESIEVVSAKCPQVKTSLKNISKSRCKF